MTARTPTVLRSQMPIGVSGSISAQDIHDIVDTVAARTPVSVREFGAAGDGIANDTPAFQAAAAASPYVYVPPGNYRVSSVTFDTAAMRLVGAGRGVSILSLTTPADTDAIRVEGTVGSFPNPASDVWGGVIEGLTLDGSAAPNMNQFAINCISAHGMVCRDLMFNRVGGGIRLKDCHMSAVEDVALWDLRPATGIGVQVDGYGDQFINRIYIDHTTPGGWNYEPAVGIQCLSTGNLVVAGGDILHCRIGIDVIAASGKLVEWFHFGPVYVDQCSEVGIRLLAQTGGTIRGGVLQGTWSSTAGTGVQVGADPGGVMNGLSLQGMRIYNCVGNGIDLHAGVHVLVGGNRIGGNGRKLAGTCSTNGTAVTLSGTEANTVMANKPCRINGVTYTIDRIVSGSQIVLRTSAGTQTGVPFAFGSDAAGVSVNPGVSSVVITGNLMGGIDTLPADQAWGVYVNTTTANMQVTGNTFRPHAQAPIAWAAGGNSDSVVADNTGIDDTPGAAAAGPTLTLPMQSTVKLTTADTVTAFGGPTWRGREVTLIPTAGAVTFAAGNNIAAGHAAPNLKPCRAYYDGASWYVG